MLPIATCATGLDEKKELASDLGRAWDCRATMIVGLAWK
jgi:hypothetical protein